jgi:hypothetical protein
MNPAEDNMPSGQSRPPIAEPETEKALRTLEGDIAEAIEKRNASLASMAIASEQSRSEEAGKKHTAKGSRGKLLIILSSILLVLIGIGAAYYLYLESPLAPGTPATPAASPIPSVVAADSQKSLDVSGMTAVAVDAAISKSFGAALGSHGSVVEIVPLEKTGTSESIVGAADFLILAGVPAPDLLTRSLNSEWMLAVYNDDGSPEPVLILTDNFFQNAYAGMIEWEKSMINDLSPLLGYSDNQSATTASPTPSTYFGIQGSFKDGVIMNKDIRAFTEPDGTVPLLYSFIDNNTIVITTDGKALSEIISRLEKQSFIR